MIFSSLVQLVRFRRFGSIRIGTPLAVLMDRPELRDEWIPSNMEWDWPVGWFDLDGLEIHVGNHNSPPSRVSLIVTRSNCAGRAALDRGNRVMFDSKGLRVGQPLSETVLHLRKLSFPCRLSRRIEPMTAYRFGPSSSLICYPTAKDARPLLYQIETT